MEAAAAVRGETMRGRMARVLKRCITGCCVAATWAACATPAAGSGGLRSEPPATGVEKAPPAPEAALAAYRAVEEWVRDWRVPEAAPEGLVEPPVVSVSLRLHGRLLGRGEAVLKRGSVRVAAAEALREAESRAPIERDALFEERLRDLAREVQVSIELSGAPVPLLARSMSEVSEQLSCGLDGVAARVGESMQVVTPAEMLLANVEPGEALATALARAASDPGVAVEVRPPGRLGATAAELGATLYRFRTVHLAQCEPGAPPAFLYRGGRVVPESSITREEIRSFAAGLAEYLARRYSPQRQGGTLWTLRGRVDASATPVRDRSHAALALLRFAADGEAPPEVAERAREAALAMLGADLGAPEPDEELGDGITSAMMVVAARAGRGAAHDELLRLHAAELYGVFSRAIDGAGDFVPEAPVGSRGMLVLAIKEANRSGIGEPFEGEPLWRTARRAALRDVPPTRIVGLMPWLGWADFGWNDGPEERARFSAAAYREVRDQAYTFQLLTGDAGEEGRDLVGGIVFPGSRSPLPTAQTARVLAFMATMLGEPALTDPDEVPREVVRLLLGVRFLRQLAVDESLRWGCVDWRTAEWAVRASPWDQRAAPEASALTLLTLTETLRSLRAIEARTTRVP